MKKIIVSFFFIVTALYSASSESKIIKLIFSALYDVNNISIYTTDKKKIAILQEAGLHISQTCSKSNIVYDTKSLQECTGKPLFTDNYLTFIEDNNAIGAFYWKKGRPNILFLKHRLERFGLRLPPKLKKYEMEEL